MLALVLAGVPDETELLEGSPRERGSGGEGLYQRYTKGIQKQ